MLHVLILGNFFAVGFAPSTQHALSKKNLFRGKKSDCGEDLIRLSDVAVTQTPDITKLYGSENEAALILLRGAIFDYQRRDLRNLYICPKHQTEFGRN